MALNTGEVVRILILARCKYWETMIMGKDWQDGIKAIRDDLDEITKIANAINKGEK